MMRALTIYKIYNTVRLFIMSKEHILGIILCFIRLLIGVGYRFISFRLSKKQIQMVKSNGLTHYTYKSHCHSILESGYIKASSSFKRKAYFFIQHQIKQSAMKSNFLIDRDASIIIKNLTDEQAQRLKYRLCDKAILHRGNFYFEKENIVKVQQF